jgi:hypothetical protein
MADRSEATSVERNFASKYWKNMIFDVKLCFTKSNWTNNWTLYPKKLTGFWRAISRQLSTSYKLFAA